MKRLFYLRTTCSLLLLLAYSIVGYAQRYNIDWVNSIGGNLDEAASSLVVDASANVYSVGYIGDTVDFDPGSGKILLSGESGRSGEYSTFIYKTDAHGTPVWAKKFAGLSNKATYIEDPSIAIDSDGYLYIAGAFSNTVDFDPGPNKHELTAVSTWDVYLVKLDTAGNLIWVKTIAGGDGGAYDITVTTDVTGNIYLKGLIGQDIDSLDFDPGPGIARQLTMEYESAFILKLSTSGDYVWAKTFPNPCRFSDVAVDPIGNVVLAGNFMDIVDLDPGPDTVSMSGLYVGFILKLNSFGNFVWAREAIGPSTGFGELKALAIDESGNIYYTGYFGNILGMNDTETDLDPGSGVKTFITNGMGDAYISSISSDGNFRWTGTFGGANNDQGVSIFVSSKGLVYAVMDIVMSDSLGLGSLDFDPGPGRFNVKGPLVGAAHPAIVILDTTGVLKWAGIVAPPSQSLNFALNSRLEIVCDGNDNVFFSGAYTTADKDQGGMVDFDPGPDSIKVSYGGSAFNDLGDIFVMRLSPCILRDTIITTACDSIVFKSKTYRQTGIYTNILQTPGLCDSVSILNLTIGNNTSETLNVAACDSFSFNGQTYKNSGNYTHVFSASTTCDSAITVALTITGTTPDTSVLQSGLTLTSLTSGVSYQWVDCGNNYTSIAGATSQNFRPGGNGSYAVVVTGNGGCSDTSGCYTIIVNTGISEASTQNALQVYPNPSGGSVTIQSEHTLQMATIKLFNVVGEVLWQKMAFNGNTLQVDLTPFASGIYTLEITEADRSMVTKLIKQ